MIINKINRNFTLCDSINYIHLQLLECGHAIHGPQWTGNIISPSYSRLYYIAGGDPYIVSGGVRKELEIGKCYLIPTGYSFRHACDTAMEQLYFHLNLNDYNGTDLLRNVENVVECDSGMEKIRRLIAYSQSDSMLDWLMLREEITSDILGMVMNSKTTLKTAHYSSCVRLAIEYIKAHLSLKISINELAAISFVSESTLAKKFKSEVGMTIGSYIDDLIMFEAEQLLLKSDMSVLQISERFGFCDQFYFSRRFKAKYGETPQKYRRLHII